jgi:hypothetical protein
MRQRQQQRRRVYDRYVRPVRDEGVSGVSGLYEEPDNSDLTEIARYPGSHQATTDEETGELVIMGPAEQESDLLEFDLDGRDRAHDRRARDHQPVSLADLNRFHARHYKSRTRDGRKAEENTIVIHNHPRGR